MCLVPEGESYPSSSVVLDTVPSTLLLGTAQRRRRLLARSPGNTTCSEFSLFTKVSEFASLTFILEIIGTSEAFCGGAEVQLLVCHLWPVSVKPCIHVWTCLQFVCSFEAMCVSCPAPSHSRKYQYKLGFFCFFPGMPLRMVIVNCGIIIEDMTGLLKDV